MSHHVSMSQSKRNACTSMRKKMAHNSSVSALINSKLPSSKSLSKTMHITSRNTSMEMKRPSKHQKSENVSPYKSKNKENSNVLQKNKSGHRKLHRAVLKQISTNIKENYK